MTPLQNPLAVAPKRALPKAVAVVGAGTIGPDIGYYLLTSIPGVSLHLVDVVPQALEKASARLHGYAEKGIAKGKLTEEQARAVRERLFTTLDTKDLAHCDWVIEAATENLALKKKIFAQLEGVLHDDALITSNTSSLPASRMFSELRRPERATVTHFFAPAFTNPAVEVIRSKTLSEENLEYLRFVFAATGKTPLVTDDAICFMLDRVFDNWCNDAALLLDRATAAEIDTVASELVHAGPFFVLNLAHGNPIIVETNTLQMEEGAHYEPARVFRSVDTWHTVAPGKSVSVDDASARRIRDRLLGILYSQAVDIVDRDIGTRADLNLGCQLALGFKRGPLDVMAQSGDAEVSRVFATLARERPGLPQPKQALAEYGKFRRHVLVDDIDGVRLLTLRRPQAMNALDDSVTDELLDAIKEGERDAKVQGFVIIGYGTRAFCAGADIGRFPSVLGDKEAAAGFARDCSRLLVHLDQMEKPVVAALNGMALGGGLELAMRCHGMVAVRDAWLQLPEVTLGIAPGIGGMVVPYRKWPHAAAQIHRMVMCAERLKATQAHELRIVDALADGYGELVALAVRRAKELVGRVPKMSAQPIELPPLPQETRTATGQALSKEVLRLTGEAIEQCARAPSVAAALEHGYDAFGVTACTAAAREGIAAFFDKRKPEFEKTG